MIAAHFDECARVGQIVLRPNRSWTWRSNTYFLCTLLTVSLIVATAFALRGYLDGAAVQRVGDERTDACLYFCVRRTHEQEVLTFSVEELIVEKGHQEPNASIASRVSLRGFHVEPAAHPWYQDRIAVQARDQRIEIGRFLSPDEKARLVSQLRLMVNRFR